MYRDVGMAVPKTTATRCRDRAYKHCTNIPIPTSFFHAQCHFPVISEHNERYMSCTNAYLTCAPCMAEVHEYQSSYQMMSDVAGHTESSSLVYRRVHMLKAPLVRLLPCLSLIHVHTVEFLCHGMWSVIIMTDMTLEC